MEEQNTEHQDAGKTAVPIAGEAADEAIIVQVGAEGGDVKLLGRRSEQLRWEFRRVTADSSWSMLDEDLDPNPPPAPNPVWVATWGEAIALLDCYSWAQLVPLTVHADFHADVLVEVTRRLLSEPSGRRDQRMAQWLRVCSGRPGE
jgi:hypothetical protein